MSADYPTARDLAEKLKGHKLGEGRYIATCPSHDDMTPSLSIDEGRNGRPVFHCHAGCDQQAVLDALIARNLWPRSHERKPKGLTLAQYADAKRLPLRFLASVGVCEESGPCGPRIVIPYYGEDRRERIVRYRVALTGQKKRFLPVSATR